MNRYFFTVLLCFSSLILFSQTYWQQAVQYNMDIDFDHELHQFAGTQKLVYANNSPDTLRQVFYHLYFNAFQPGSAMDIRSQTISDPDTRIGNRISTLKPDEIGYQKIESIKSDGKDLKHTVQGTLMIVDLNEPILPGKSATFEMKFNGQVPVQIRRSGRNNDEGVDYTMTQWYPKLAEYDKDGWHTDAYVAREFYGVFGSFDVTIHIASKFVLAGTGSKKLINESNGKKTWQFKANNVHDFAWAADPEFIHSEMQVPNGPILHFYHRNDTAINENWKKLEPQAVKLFEIMNAEFGKYPYDEFSVIQAGDGGMEYPMCTMISGTGKLGGLISVTVHEAIHNWFYGVLASNESKYPWMDEGFTTYAQNLVLDSLRGNSNYNPHLRSYRSYTNYVTKNIEEPLTTHADHYQTNQGYGVAAYSKGCIFLNQLRYLLGDEVFSEGMHRYWNEWKFKHPTPQDFKRVMEKTSNLQLDWYFESWIGTSQQIDYAIRQITSEDNKTKVLIERLGAIPMPLEIDVTTKKGIKHYYIPLESMGGNKSFEKNQKVEIKKDWIWTYEFYELTLNEDFKTIERIEIDPKQMTADVDRSQNVFPFVTQNLIQKSE